MLFGLLSLIVSCGGNSNTSSSSTSSFNSSSSSSSSSSTSFNSSSSGLPLPPQVSQKVVRFVYFIEQGESYSPAYFDAIKTQAFYLQQYWQDQFGGTFYLYNNVVDVIYADHEANWYLTNADGIHSDERWYRLGNIKREVYSKLGLSSVPRSTSAQVRIINYPTTRHDGRVGANFGGAWMDGDDLSCLLGSSNGYNFPYDENSPAHCTGHVAHEFGHIFGLDHTGPNEDCMQYGFYISTINGNLCSFSESNRNIVKGNASNLGWLDAAPGQVVNTNGEVEMQ